MSLKLRSLARFSILAVLVLTGCQTQDNAGTITYEAKAPPEIAPPPEEPPVELDADFQRARILADILYEARLAYEDNRLMSPSGNNAYDHYQQVLALDPGNEVAVQGLESIAQRYIELAGTAMANHQVENAENYLARARSLNPERPELKGAYQRLDQARQTKVEVFALDVTQLSEQSLDLMITLADIAEHIRGLEATFLIKARSDAEGRWIYKVMRESVGGYRLRGNIDIGASPNITVNLPKG